MIRYTYVKLLFIIIILVDTALFFIDILDDINKYKYY